MITKNFLVARLIALVVCLCFSANTILLAVPEALPNLSSRLALSKPFDISIPADFGKINEINIPTNCLHAQEDCSFVVYLQDAHANLGAQRNIQKILRSFSEKSGIRTILTEGATGRADLSTARALSDQKLKELTAEFLLQQVILTGLESEAIVSPQPYEILGIENQALYDQNVTQFNQALELGKLELPQLHELLKENNQLRLDRDNVKLIEFEKKTSFLEKRSELIQLVSYLMNQGRELGIKRGDLVHIEKLVSLILLERAMEGRDGSAAEKEAFEQASKEIGASELFYELDELKSRIREKLFLTSEERVRFHESVYLKNLNSLLSLQATPNDVRDFQSKRLEILGFSNSKSIAQNAIEAAALFYETSIRREESFFQNVKLQIQGKKKVFLVTGGFHADHLTERFRREQIPFVVISPAVSPETDFERYYERLQGEKVTFEKFESKFLEFIKSSAILFQPKIFDPAFPDVVNEFYEFARSELRSIPTELRTAQHLTSIASRSAPSIHKDNYRSLGLPSSPIDNSLTTRAELRQIDQFDTALASRASRASSELRAKNSETMDFKDLDELRKTFTNEQTITVGLGEKFSLVGDGVDSPEILNILIKSLTDRRIQIKPKSYEWILLRKTTYIKKDIKKVRSLFDTKQQEGGGIWLSPRENSVLIARKESRKIVIIGEIVFLEAGFDPERKKTIQIRTLPGIDAFPHHKRLTYPTSLSRLFSRLLGILKNDHALIKELEMKKDGMWIAATHFFEQSLRNNNLFDALAKILVVNLSVPDLTKPFKEILDSVRSAIRKLIITTFDDPYYRAVIKGNLMWFLMDHLQPAVSALYFKHEEAKELNRHIIQFVRHILQTYYGEHIERAQNILISEDRKKNLSELKMAIYHLKRAGKYLDRVKRYYSRSGLPNQFQSEERELAKWWAVTNSQFRNLSRLTRGENKEIETLVKVSKSERKHRFQEAMREGGRTPYDVDVEELIGLSIAEDLNSSRHFIIRSLARLINKDSLLDILIGDSGADKEELDSEGVDILADRRVPLSVMLALTKLGTQGKRLGARLYQTIQDHEHDGRRQPIIDVLANEIRSVGQTDDQGNPSPGSNSYDAHVLKTAIIKLEKDIKSDETTKSSKTKNFTERVKKVFKYYNWITNLRMPNGFEQYKPFEPDPELIVHLLLHAGVFQNIVGFKPLREALQHILELNVFGEIRERKSKITKEDLKELFDKNEWFSESRIGKEGRDTLRTIFILTDFLDPSEQYRDIIPEVVGKVDEAPTSAIVFQRWPSHYTPVEEAKFIANHVAHYLHPDYIGELDFQGLPANYQYGEGVRATQLNKHVVQKLWFQKFLSKFISEVNQRTQKLRRMHYEIASRSRGEVSAVMHQAMLDILKNEFDKEMLNLMSEDERVYLIDAEKKAAENIKVQRNSVIENKADNVRRVMEDIFNHMMPQLVSLASSSKTKGKEEEGSFPSPSAEQVIRAFHLIKPGVPVVDLHLTILPKQGATGRDPINVTATRIARDIIKQIPIQKLNWSQVVSQSAQAPVNQLADPDSFDLTEPVMFLNVEVDTKKIRPLPLDEFREALLGTFFMSFAATIRGHEGRASDWDPHQIYDHMLITNLSPSDIQNGEEKLKEFLDALQSTWKQTPIVVLYGRHRPLEPTEGILKKHYLKRTGSDTVGSPANENTARSELRMSGIFSGWSFFSPTEAFFKGVKNQARNVFPGTAMKFETEDYENAAYSLEFNWDTDGELEKKVIRETKRFNAAIEREIRKEKGVNSRERDQELIKFLQNARQPIVRHISKHHRSANFLFSQMMREQISKLKAASSGDSNNLRIKKWREARDRVLGRIQLNDEQIEEEIKFFQSVIDARMADYRMRVSEFSSETSEEAKAILAFVSAFKYWSGEIVKLIRDEKRSSIDILVDCLDPAAVQNLKEDNLPVPNFANQVDQLRKMIAQNQAKDQPMGNIHAQLNEVVNTLNYILASLRHARQFEQPSVNNPLDAFAHTFNTVMQGLPEEETIQPGSEDARLLFYLYQLQGEVAEQLERRQTYAELALHGAASKIFGIIEKDINNLRKQADANSNQINALEKVRKRFEKQILSLHKHVRRKIAPQSKYLAEKNLVVFAKEMSTLHFIDLSEAYPNLKAVVTENGSPAEHWAAVAAPAKGIVAITQAKQFSDSLFSVPNPEPLQIKSGFKVYVNGAKGILVVNPAKTTIDEFEKERIDEIALRQLSFELTDRPVNAIKDGIASIPIKLSGIASTIGDVLASSQNKDDQEKPPLEKTVSGIGLWRTEYTDIPRKIEEVKAYQQKLKEHLILAARKMPEGIVVRLIDLSPDKVKELGINTKAFGIDFYKTDLGREIVLAQMRAILSAHLALWQESAGPVSILIPMIRGHEDIQFVMDLWDLVRSEFLSSGELKTDRKDILPMGFMVETKEMVANLPEILDQWEPDFLSIGSNDYTKEFTGAERASNHRAYSKSDPELWASIEHQIVRPAVERRIPVCVCGDLAGWRRFALFWVNLAGRLIKEGFSPELSLAVQSGVAPLLKHFIRYVDYDEGTVFRDYEKLKSDFEKDGFDESLTGWRDQIEETIKETDAFRRVRRQIEAREAVRSELRNLSDSKVPETLVFGGNQAELVQKIQLRFRGSITKPMLDNEIYSIDYTPSELLESYVKEFAERLPEVFTKKDLERYLSELPPYLKRIYNQKKEVKDFFLLLTAQLSEKEAIYSFKTAVLNHSAGFHVRPAMIFKSLIDKLRAYHVTVIVTSETMENYTSNMDHFTSLFAESNAPLFIYLETHRPDLVSSEQLDEAGRVIKEYIEDPKVGDDVEAQVDKIWRGEDLERFPPGTYRAQYADRLEAIFTGGNALPLAIEGKRSELRSAVIASPEGKIIVSISELENEPALVEAIKKSISENPASPVEIAIVAEEYVTGIEAEPMVQKLFGEFDIFGKNSGTDHVPRAQLYARDRLGVARELSSEQAYRMVIDKLRADLGLDSGLTTRIVAVGERNLLTDLNQKIAKVTSAAESLSLAELLIVSDDADQYTRFADEFGIISPTAAMVESLMHTILEKALIESAA